MADLAEVEKLQQAWRTLKPVEVPRAQYYIGAASRRIRRRWKDVDARILSGELDAGDVADVVVQMILGILDGAPVHRARSWSETAGPFAKTVTLESGRAGYLAFEDWMVEIFDGISTASPVPLGGFPPSGRYEHAFIWPEGCD